MSEAKEQLQQFLRDSNQRVANVANDLLKLYSRVERGEMSENEFAELAGDVVDLININDLTVDIKTAKHLDEAEQALRALIPKLVGAVM